MEHRPEATPTHPSARQAALVAVVEALRTLDDFAVIGHVDPDLDSVGSVLALAGGLREGGPGFPGGKRVVAVSPDPLPAYWQFIPGYDGLVVGPAAGQLRVQVAVVVDTDFARERLGSAWELARSAPVRINIDHHATNQGEAHHRLVDPTAAATGELVYEVLEQLGAALTPDRARCLYAALLTDTGSFQFSNTTARVLDIAARLVRAGADPHDLALRIYGTRPWNYLTLLGQALSRLERTPDGRVAWLVVTREMAEAAGLLPNEVEGLVQYPRMVEGVEVALLFKELSPRRTRVSLRSRRFVDVSALASLFGGGGHLRAAGCTVELPVADAVARVVQAAAAEVAAPARDGQGRNRSGKGSS